MSEHTTRWVSFGGRTIAIECNAPQAVELVEFLYHHIPSDEQTPPHVAYRLFYQDERFTLHRESELLCRGTSPALLAGYLLGDSGYHLADTSQDGLFFHAAGLTWQGQGVMLPGSSGAGKTTLTAWLLSKGFQYLTDEFLFLPENSTLVEAFTRPLNVKLPSRPILQAVFDYEAHAADILSHHEADLIPAELLGETKPTNQAELAVVIFPRYQADGHFTLRQLTKAQAGLKLMQVLINARNLPGHGLPQITRLAQTVPAYEMAYANFEQIEGQIEALLG